MASLRTIQAVCTDIANAQHLPEVAQYIRELPVIVLNNEGVAAICAAIPRIITKDQSTCFDYNFLKTIFRIHREEITTGIQKSIPLDRTSNRDWPAAILRTYARSLVGATNGACFEHGNIWTPEWEKEDTGYERPFDMIAWVPTIVNWSNPDLFAKQVAQSFLRSVECMSSFVNVYCDAMVPVRRQEEATAILTTVAQTCAWAVMPHRSWLPHGVDDKGPLFVDRCREGDIKWLQDTIRAINWGHNKETDYVLDETVIATATEIFMNLRPIFQDQFAAETVFFEMLSELSYYLPLSQQRMLIAQRYEEFFGDDAMNYMADFTTVIGENVGKLTFCIDNPRSHTIERTITIRAEAIILDLHRKYPEVPEKVVVQFFEDICNCFGRGLSGFAPGCMLYIRPIIHGVFEKDLEAIESDTDYIDLLMALEADDAEEIGVKGDDDDALDRAKLHRTSGRGAVKSAMKSGERKIFNAWHKYKSGEEKVDNVLNKGVAALKKAMIGDQRTLIIEGKKWSTIGFLKKVLATIAIFNFGKVRAILFLITRNILKGKANRAEKKKLLSELELELQMVNEKIEDARSDGNREAKYALMRTRNALQEAINRVKYGVGAEQSNEKLWAGRNTGGYEG